MAPQVSIIVPTYNESQNILGVLRSIRESIPSGVSAETIVVDDDSPDGTGRMAEEYASGLSGGSTMDVVHRTGSRGLSSAIMHGIRRARGEMIVVMDSDFSHPPQLIPRLVEALRQCELAIASRYVSGGGVRNWPARRRILSRAATLLARRGLGIRAADPMSGFFAFRRGLLSGLSIDALGYKLLLEIIVKTKGVRVLEVPYVFEDRRSGSSKLDGGVALDYLRSVWRLYRYGRARRRERRASVRFASKAARFFTVGASGLAVNYLVSLLASSAGGFWYVHGSMLGIAASVVSNFVLNKAWTFEDRDFGARRTLWQLARFAGLSSLGAVLQIGAVYWLVGHHGMSYHEALVLAVSAAAFGNFALNKRLTFGERLWD
ncbi:MAG: glycosyltransferase family 2 protein [Nitrosopumilus sp.]|nr:glycosyltransferase family 2 protein [Nitrosopumilus sp.]MDA7942935.1 glycosyltransferase family 2 protein [Nitrosopumilus sp.]MDA7998400.1 glycosyltransferase family 2 protein [Nitrosopumilus sp.]